MSANPNRAPIPKLAGVCGWPIHHSLSPALHSWWLREMGLRGAYIPFAVRPDKAARAFRSLPKTSIVGVNVTLPLKEIAFEVADQRTADARQLGAANLLVRSKGRLIAHNTDLEGFAEPLLKVAPAEALQHATALVVGAGGAARAVIGALIRIGVPEIRITARREAQARDLAERFSVPSLYVTDWAARDTAVRGAGLIVNATSGGMAGKAALDLDLEKAQPGAVAYDLIYTPRETPFLRDARERGLRPIGGMDMLIAQARPSFRAFFGGQPPDELDPTDLLRSLL